MSYQNIRLTLNVGNLWSRIQGPAPIELLDRELNPHRARLLQRSMAAGSSGAGLLFRARSQEFLTGALPRVKRILRREGIHYRLRDDRFATRRRFDLPVEHVPLRPYQEIVVERALARGRGVIDVGTGGGKTRIAAELIARLGLPTLYLVTTRALMLQSVARLSRLLGTQVGVIGGGENAPAPVTVALVQALFRDRVDLAAWQDGMLIFDEGHHAAADTFAEVVENVDARHHFFLTAVPFRPGREQALLDALTGGSLTDRSFAAAYLIAHGYAAPVRVRVEPMRLAGDMLERPFWDLYREFIVDNETRNARIAELAREEAGRAHSTLVLVEHLRHGRKLLKLLGEGALFVHGGLSRAQLEESVEAFSDGRARLLVATAACFNEGIDIHGIHCVVNAGGLSSRVRVLQAIGRGMRLAKGKKEAVFVDFLDTCETGAFRRHSMRRLAIMRGEGFHVPAVEEQVLAGADPEPAPRAEWAHVPGTEKFIQLGGDGEVLARAVCLKEALVPDRICKRCRDKTVCKAGGTITWRA